MKKSSRVLCHGVAARSAIMKTVRLTCPLPCMNRIPERGYYAWLNRQPSQRAQEETQLEIQIRLAHKRTRETCGPERLQKDLADHGIVISIHRIRKIRKKLGIRCKQIKKFKATTHSKHNLPVADNLLEQNCEASLPKMVWVSDIRAP